MKFNRLAGIAAIVLGTIFSTSCGETFRPVATPIFGSGGDPQNARQAIVVSSAGGAQGGVTHINVSGDTVAAQMAAGIGAKHLTVGGAQVWTANAREANTTHYFPTFAPNVTPATTTLTSADPLRGPEFVFSSGTAVFAALTTQNRVSIVSLTNSTETKSVDLSAPPSGFAAGTVPVAITGTSDGSKVYIANQGSGNVTVLNSDGTYKATIGVGTTPSWITINHDNSRVYVVNSGSGNVSVIDATNDTFITNIDVGTNPTFAIFDPIALKLYVANNGSSSVSVITGTALVGTFPVAANPTAIAPLRDGSRYYVSHENSTTVNVMSALNNQLLRTITVGTGAKHIAASPDNSKVYVANTTSGTVSVIRTSDDTVVATINMPANHQPQFIVINP